MPLTSNVNLRSKILPPVLIGNNLFTHSELHDIRTYCESKELNQSEVLHSDDSSVKDNELRKSKCFFHHYNDELAWFFQKTFTVMETLNNDYFGFDLVGYDFFQYTVYNEGDFYSWHTDAPFGQILESNSNYARKLSATLVLSYSSEYTGGEFEIMDRPNDPTTVEQDRGTLIVFPSFINHRVHEVKSGSRKSIVIWALGPPFK